MTDDRRACSASSSFRRARRKASRSCARRAGSSQQLKPAFCSVTFGAGGSTREGTLATVLEFRAEGMEAAPHISCMGGARASIARSARAIQGARHPPSRRAARRPAVRSGRQPAISASRASSSPSSGRKRATGSTSTSPPTPNATRRPDRCRRTSPRSSARSTRAPIRRSRSISTIPMRTGTSSTRAARRESTCRSFPASCRSAATRSSRAFRMPAAPRSRAGSARSSQGYGDDIGVDPRVRPRRGHRPRGRAARARRAGPALLHAEPGGAHHDDLAAPRDLSGQARSGAAPRR